MRSIPTTLYITMCKCVPNMKFQSVPYYIAQWPLASDSIKSKNSKDHSAVFL